MHRARLVAAFAAFAGICALVAGALLLYYLPSVESLRVSFALFPQTDYSPESWRMYALASNVLTIGFGAACLLAALGLFRGKKWARWLWLALCIVAVLAAVPGAVSEPVVRLWIVFLVFVLALSWVATKELSDGA